MKITFVALALALGGCVAQGSLGALQGTITGVAESPLAVCSQVISQSATSLAQLRAQLNGATATGP